MSEHEKTIREALHEYESCALSLNSDAGKWSAGDARTALDAMLSEHRSEVERLTVLANESARKLVQERTEWSKKHAGLAARLADMDIAAEDAREEGRKAGLEEAASEALGWADPDSDGAEAFARLAEILRARASKASKRVEAFEVPSAGVAAVLHSVVPVEPPLCTYCHGATAVVASECSHCDGSGWEPSELEGAHKLGTNSEDVAKALETIRAYVRGAEDYERLSAWSAVGTLERALDDLRREVEAHRLAREETQRLLNSERTRREVAEARSAQAERGRDSIREASEHWHAAKERAEVALERETDLRIDVQNGLTDMRKARDAAEADNAAMLAFIKDVMSFRQLRATGFWMRGLEITQGATHPGAALLERLRTLESERNAVEKVNAALTAHVRALEHGSVSRARVLEVLDAMDVEDTTYDDLTGDAQEAFDAGFEVAVCAVRESLGLDNKETGR